jgi:hypothetical protein
VKINIFDYKNPRSKSILYDMKTYDKQVHELHIHSSNELKSNCFRAFSLYQ